MHTNIKAILGQNLFNHISYIVLSRQIFLLTIYNYLVDILVLIYHYYLRDILDLVSLDYPNYGWFDRYCMLWYWVIGHLLNRCWRSTKETNDSTYLLCKQLVTVVSVLNQRTIHCGYLLCKHVNHLVITLVHLLPYRLDKLIG